MEEIVISSGHGLYVRGARGVLDEVDEARRVVNRVAEIFRLAGGTAYTFHDDVSRSQNENLERIVDYHNSQERWRDVSIHFNAYVETANPMGTEVLYASQWELANSMSAAIANAGRFIDRGHKLRNDLYFLNYTDQPAILIEVCFVDSEKDADLYQKHFEEICQAIAQALL